MRYGIEIEKLESNYSADVPDLPGCVATGATIEEIQQQIKEAIAFHLDGLAEEGLPIPQPTLFVNILNLLEKTPQARSVFHRGM
ncbi:MAG: type II toxin-antitoxin system HicB family antitoxin [Symploca sp. SIO1B1]|nr:type II toxin-antitoxin system HicB family antitoxin [Symploca sp. SIO1B1]